MISLYSSYPKYFGAPHFIKIKKKWDIEEKCYDSYVSVFLEYPKNCIPYTFFIRSSWWWFKYNTTEAQYA